MTGTPDYQTLGSVTVLGIPQPDAPVSRVGTYTVQQTGTAIWTPAAGKRVVISDISVSTATAGRVTIYDGAGLIREYHVTAYGGAVDNLEVHLRRAVDDVIRVTTNGAMTLTVTLGGYEV